jgi:hypothetical protein
VTSGKPVALRHLGLPRLAAAEPLAFGQQVRPRRPVDRPVDAAAAQKRLVRRVHDRIHVERRDIGLDHLYLRHGTPSRMRAGPTGARRSGPFAHLVTISCTTPADAHPVEPRQPRLDHPARQRRAIHRDPRKAPVVKVLPRSNTEIRPRATAPTAALFREIGHHQLPPAFGAELRRVEPGQARHLNPEPGQCIHTVSPSTRRRCGSHRVRVTPCIHHVAQPRAQHDQKHHHRCPPRPAPGDPPRRRPEPAFRAKPCRLTSGTRRSACPRWARSAPPTATAPAPRAICAGPRSRHPKAGPRHRADATVPRTCRWWAA